MLPFVYKFESGGNKYLYDVNTNLIGKIDEIVWDIIPLFFENDDKQIVSLLMNKYKRSHLEKRLSMLRELNQKKGFLGYSRPRYISHSIRDKNEISKLYNDSLPSLCLCVTEKCNLNCTYCIYSKSYYLRNRKNHKSMTWDIAKKAIDWFYDHSAHPENAPNNPTGRVGISFYGGEPLLNFCLIRDVVYYVNNKFRDRKINYHVTSNLTILTDEMIEFFIENQFRILVSLDGPQVLHDRYRSYSDKKGTYVDVEQNLQRIMDVSLNYYKMNVNFNMVLAPPYNFVAVDEFIASSDLFFDKTIIHFNNVDPYDTDFYKQFNIDTLDTSNYFEPLLSYFIDLCNNGEINIKCKKNIMTRNLILNRYQNIFKYIFSGEVPKFEELLISHRLCNPGLNRLFVNVKGDFYPCERIVEGSNMKIGDIYFGINVDRCIDLINTYYRLINEECVNCWAIRFCNLLCFKGWMDREPIDFRKRNVMCDSIRKFYSNGIGDVIRIAEEAPAAFDFFIDKSLMDKSTLKSN